MTVLDTEPIRGNRQRDGRPSRCLMVRNRGDALRIAGLREQIHPDDVVALIYPERAYFEESAAAGRAGGDTVHGPYETASGLLGIVDFRQGLERGVTDPSLPDCPAGAHSHRRVSGRHALTRVVS